MQGARVPAEAQGNAQGSLGAASAKPAPLLAVLAGSQEGVPCDRTGRQPDPFRLHEAVQGLAARSPELSAATGLPRWQKGALAGLVATAGGGALLAPEATLVALLAVMAVPFLLVVALRAASLWHLLEGAPPLIREETAPSADGPLPLYTVLVPLYREADVVDHLLNALARINYSADRLEVILIVESVDPRTQAALEQAALAPCMRVLVVPDGSPRTKPRALQYALQFARGDYVVVYDAEDVPEPDQLRRALAALRADPGRLGCLQAQLNIYNSRTSWLTRGIMAQTPLAAH